MGGCSKVGPSWRTFGYGGNLRVHTRPKGGAGAEPDEGTGNHTEEKAAVATDATTDFMRNLRIPNVGLSDGSLLHSVSVLRNETPGKEGRTGSIQSPISHC